MGVRPRPASGLDKRSPLTLRQSERIGEALDGFGIWKAPNAAFKVGDSARAQAGPLGQGPWLSAAAARWRRSSAPNAE
jgi:hypothetical protein